MVRLSLGLSAVRRFDLSDQAKYFFIPFNGTSKTKQQQNSNISTKKKKKKKKKTEKENDRLQMGQNLLE